MYTYCAYVRGYVTGQFSSFTSAKAECWQSGSHKLKVFVDVEACDMIKLCYCYITVVVVVVVIVM